MKKPDILACALGMLLTCTSARAELLAYEPFATGGSDYALGNVVGQNPASFGFSGAWARTQPGQPATFEVIAPALGVTGNPGLGGAARFTATLTPGALPEDPPTNTFPNFTRSLSAPLAQSVLYYSLMFRQDDLSATQRSEFRLVGPDGDVRIGTNANAISLDSNLPDAVSLGTVDSAQVGIAQQWVVKIDSANGTATFWKNPGYGLIEDPLDEPTQTLSFTPGTYSFTSIHVTCFVNGEGTRTATYDEIKIGETIADVTAAPTPPTGDIVAYEPFDLGTGAYETGNLVGQDSSTFGMIGNWSRNRAAIDIGTSAAVIDTTLSRPEFSSSGGAAQVTVQRIEGVPQFTNFQRSLAYPLTDDVIYFSVFYVLNSAGATQRSELRLNGPQGFLSIGTNNALLELRSNIGGNGGQSFNNLAGGIGATQQLLVKADRTTGTFSFWLNPGVDLMEDPAVPSQSITFEAPESWTFNNVFITGFTNGNALSPPPSTNTRISTFDEIRVGRTINSVTSAVVFPVIQLPMLAIETLNPSGARLTITGNPGEEFQLSESTDLGIMDDWEPLGDPLVIPEPGVIQVDDATAEPRRFYRLGVDP